MVLIARDVRVGSIHPVDARWSLPPLDLLVHLVWSGPYDGFVAGGCFFLCGERASPTCCRSRLLWCETESGEEVSYGTDSRRTREERGCGRRGYGAHDADNESTAC